MTYRLIGSSVTDKNGHAVLNYQGTGVGIVNIVASLSSTITEGSITDDLSLTDALFYDDGVSNVASWYDNGKFLKTVDDTGTLLECQEGNTWASATPGGMNHAFTIPFTVIFNVVSVNTAYIQLSNINGTTKRITINTTGEHTITVTRTGVYVDGSLSNLGVPSASSSVVVLQLGDDEKSIKFKDFKVYPKCNGGS